MKRLPTLLLIASIAGLGACSKQAEPPAPAAGAPKAPAAGPAAAGPGQFPNSGRILQIQQGGGYSYVEVEGPTGQRAWLAGAALQAKPGDTLQWADASLMQNFTAKSLGRTFDQILFVSAWGLAGGPAAQVAPHGTPPAHPAPQAAPVWSAAQPAPMPSAAPAGQGASQGEVRSAVTAGGYTYLEVAQGAGTVWLAAPETQVKPGDKVRWDGGATMQNFTAKSIGRTFDQIVFANGVQVVR